MNSSRSLTLVAAALSAFAAGAQTPAAMPPDHDVHHPAGAALAPPADPAARSAVMDKPMQPMHAKMNSASTPAQRKAAMAEHMALMQQGMALMGGMGPGAMGAGMGKDGMPGMQGGAGMDAVRGGPAMPADMAVRHQWMEERMDMMQSMMRMMMDRMAAPAARP